MHWARPLPLPIARGLYLHQVVMLSLLNCVVLFHWPDTIFDIWTPQLLFWRFKTQVLTFEKINIGNKHVYHFYFRFEFCIWPTGIYELNERLSSWYIGVSMHSVEVEESVESTSRSNSNNQVFDRKLYIYSFDSWRGRGLKIDLTNLEL